MPIVFESPSAIATPAGAAAAVAGGEVPEINSLAALYQKYAALGAQQQGQQLANSGRIVGGNQAGNEQAASQATALLAQQNNQIAQQKQQQSQQEQQLALQANQFTFADQMQLSKMQNGASQLKSMLADGSIDQEGYTNGMAQLNGVMGPELLKQQRQKTQMQQEALQQEQSTNALQGAGIKTLASVLTNSPDGVKRRDDGSVEFFYDGKTLKHVEPKADTSETKLQLAAQKADESFFNRENTAAKNYQNEREHAEKIVQARYAERMKTDPNITNAAIYTPDENGETNFDKEVKKIMGSDRPQNETELRRQMRTREGRDPETGMRRLANQGSGGVQEAASLPGIPKELAPLLTPHPADTDASRAAQTSLSDVLKSNPPGGKPWDQNTKNRIRELATAISGTRQNTPEVGPQEAPPQEQPLAQKVTVTPYMRNWIDRNKGWMVNGRFRNEYTGNDAVSKREMQRVVDTANAILEQEGK